MDIFKIVAFVVATVILVIILNDTKKEMAVILSIVAGLVILTSVLLELEGVLELLKNLINKAGVNSKYLEVILKVTGIAYIVEFCKNICIDSGQSALATKVELAGKISIAVLTIPIITTVVSVITELV